MPAKPLVIALLGPTASGKTALSLEIAERLGLAVINVDSRQLYRGMDVGTAKPTPAQQARAPHHLLDLRDPDQPITLQEFQAAAEPCIAQELERHGTALLVGGSGLYLKALTDGLKPPAVAQPAPGATSTAGQHPIHCCSNPTPPQPPKSPLPMPCAPSGPWKSSTERDVRSAARPVPRRHPGGCWSWD